jgi:hypothetical protein
VDAHRKDVNKMDKCPNCGTPVNTNWIIEKRIFFWPVRITNLLDLRKFNIWDKVSISLDPTKALIVLKALAKFFKVTLPDLPSALPSGSVVLPDVGSFWICFGCGKNAANYKG